MTLVLSAEVLSRIRRHGEEAYPNEGAGFLLGLQGSRRMVTEIWSAAESGCRRSPTQPLLDRSG